MPPSFEQPAQNDPENPWSVYEELTSLSQKLKAVSQDIDEYRFVVNEASLSKLGLKNEIRKVAAHIDRISKKISPDNPQRDFVLKESQQLKNKLTDLLNTMDLFEQRAKDSGKESIERRNDLQEKIQDILETLKQ